MRASWALPELKHDLAPSQEPQLRAGDALHGGGVVAQIGDVDAELRHVAAELGVLRVDLRELLFEEAHPGEPLRLEDEERHRDERHAQHGHRQEALERPDRGGFGGHGIDGGRRTMKRPTFLINTWPMGVATNDEERRPYDVVVGLEVHAQLATRTKLFCSCETTFGAPPNTHVCPVCAGHPGTLPVPNAEAVRLAVRACLTMGTEVSETSRFSRKNYFYPDLPKGYQISQFDEPLGKGGVIVVPLEGGGTKVARIERIHMEEDAGKNVHEGRESLVDLNRAGTPLVEIVGRPDLSSGREAAEYLRILRDALVFAGVNDGNLEEGSFRCDANVSVKPRGEEKLGTRVELKNINSFKFVERAITIEAARQIEVLEGGGRLVAETRGWDEKTETTFSMREKETAQDYRYFPEPDLLPLVIDEAFLAEARASLPEGSASKRVRYTESLGLTPYAAEVLTQHPKVAAYFEEAVALGADPVALGNFVQAEVLADVTTHGLDATFPIPARALSELLSLVKDGTISGKQGKELYREVKARVAKGSVDVRALAESLGMRQLTDETALRALCEKVVADAAKQRDDYRRGKKGLFGFFVGQVMKASQGKANPKRTNEILTEILEASPQGAP